MVRHGDRESSRGAWEHTDLPAFAGILAGRVAFAWHAIDALYEEDERILGHAFDACHRIDIRQTSRHLVVRAGEEVIAETHRPLVLYESGFAPRWYVPREVDRIDDLISFEPDRVTVTIDGERLELAPGQQVVPRGPDRGLTPDEAVNPVLS